MKCHPGEWQVILLCRTDPGVMRRVVRRQVFLVDHPQSYHSGNLIVGLKDVVDTIDALLGEDLSRPNLVHCHGSRSRTAFVLKGWAIRRFGWTQEQAHEWLQDE